MEHKPFQVLSILATSSWSIVSISYIGMEHLKMHIELLDAMGINLLYRYGTQQYLVAISIIIHIYSVVNRILAKNDKNSGI